MTSKFLSRMCPQGHRASPLRQTAIASALLLALGSVGAQTAASTDAKDAAKAKADGKEKVESVVVLGSRAHAKTALDTAAPVGLISAAELKGAGPVELGKLLQTIDPSFNFSTTFISDGTDIIRPATLRSLGPDQMLVLINGKRRHQQALVNVQQTIGRGSAGTDINAIPLAAIERVEILRDGAAAQYGSDAIAGVLNIILKKQTSETQLGAMVGQTKAGDGKLVSGSVNQGFQFGPNAYLNLTAEGRKRGETNRAGPDTLRVDPPRVTQRIGDSDARDAYLWWNGAFAAGSSNGEVYTFGGVSHRTGDSAGFFRSKGDNRTVPALYPEGFLPNIRTTVDDMSLAFGYRTDLSDGWSVDAGLNHGESKFGFSERNTVNVSYWYEPKPGGGIYAESPTSANTGTLKFHQTTFNVDFKGPVAMGDEPLYLATGFEYRQDGYGIDAGDPVSYQYGRKNDPSVVIYGQDGKGIAAAGTQGFPGYTPATAVDASRHNVALYLDAERTVAKGLTLGGALRYEKYSDFGATTIGKLTLRYDPTKEIGLRGSVSTGFRAPGVQQANYSSVSTALNGKGELTETLTARQGSAVTKAFGLPNLKQETSRNASLGLVFHPSKDFSFTVDAYQITIDDRIVFSSEIGPEDNSNGKCGVNNANCPIRAILDPLHVGQAQFFTNAISTKTTGLDLVAVNTTHFSSDSTLVLSGQLGFNKTEVTKRHSLSPVLTGNALFDDAQVRLIEHGQPAQKHVFSADYTQGALTTTVRANYFGEVSAQYFTGSYVQTWDAKWLTDLSFRYALNSKTSISIGGNNIFNTYPTKWDEKKAFPFPQLGFTYCWETCPFGINGASYYAKIDVAF